MDDRDAFLRASWANVLGNVLKIVVEGTIGLAFGSLALVADAAHSLADLLASVVVLVWGRLSFTAADADHPHGHQRIEPLTALFVGTTLVALALLLLSDSIHALRSEPDVTFGLPLLGALVVGTVDMVLVYLYTVRSNRDLGSPSLEALAKDCLNDVFTSMAAVVGVFGVAVGFPVLDAVAGGLVSVLVLVQGVQIFRENIAYLVGRAPPTDIRQQIAATIRSHDAVEGVHDLRVYYIGTELEVEYHAEVAGEYTLREAHRIETELNESLRDLEEVGDVHTHLDPAGVGEWKDALE